MAPLRWTPIHRIGQLASSVRHGIGRVDKAIHVGGRIVKAVKEHLLNYKENWYEMSIILDSIKTLIETQQKEHESLSYYTRRFKVS